MKKELLKTRIFDKKLYQFYLEDEKIVCYPVDSERWGNKIILSTGQNFNGLFGQPDKIAVPQNRPVTPWILKKIEAVMIKLYTQNIQNI